LSPFIIYINLAHSAVIMLADFPLNSGVAE